MRDSMRDLLRLWGHVSEGAADGVEGLAQVLLFKPDVALVDLGLPRMDGYEVARQIRAQEAGRDVLLIALSGYGQPADREAAEAAGFDRHIVKPPDLVQLESRPARRSARHPERAAAWWARRRRVAIRRRDPDVVVAARVEEDVADATCG